MKYLIVIFLVYCFIEKSDAQTFTLSGNVKEVNSNEKLAGVLVIDSLSKKSTMSDAEGRFKLKLSNGQHFLLVNSLGYQSLLKEVILNQDTEIELFLIPQNKELNEVIVLAAKVDNNLTSTEIGVEKLSIKQIERIPIIMGETDILKTIQLLPGINSVAEGRAGFIVRGGGIDQNLMLMDEMPIYYASHMQGLYSVYNSAAVNSLTVYKGGVPPRFGGRGSSVLDVRMVEGNLEKYKASVSMGLITSKFALEAPLIKNKLSLFVAGRATSLGFGNWYDQIKRKNNPKEIPNSKVGSASKSISNGDYFFDQNEWWFDVNGKIIYQISPKSKLSLSVYSGRDNAITAGGDTRWGNTASHLKWNQTLNSKWHLSTSLITSKYFTHALQSIYDFASSINTYSFKSEALFNPNDKNNWRFGVQSEYQDFNHGSLQDKTQSDGGKFMPPMQGLESAFYVENEQKITDKLTALYGVRLSMYNRLGKGYSNVYDAYTNLSIEQSYYNKYTSIIKTYINPEPRISATYRLNQYQSIKASYNRNAQYLRLMTLGSDITWYDIWMPTTENIKPNLVDQMAIGYFRNMFDNKIEISTEAYYKTQNGIADFEDGLHNYLVNNLEAYVAQGRGKAYGIEFSIEKPRGDFTSRLSYNLGRSMMKIDVINKGRWYHNMFDITHSLNFLASYNLKKIEPLKWFTVSMNFVYYTGRPVTLPESYYYVGNVAFPYWENRNSYRLPDFHRMDFGLKYEPEFLSFTAFKNKQLFQPSLDISLYNVYNRRNLFTIDFVNNSNSGKSTDKGTTVASNVFSSNGRSTYGFIPSFQLNLKF